MSLQKLFIKVGYGDRWRPEFTNLSSLLSKDPSFGKAESAMKLEEKNMIFYCSGCQLKTVWLSR